MKTSTETQAQRASQDYWKPTPTEAEKEPDCSLCGEPGDKYEGRSECVTCTRQRSQRRYRANAAKRKAQFKLQYLATKQTT